jgi:hypothetical protein
MKFHLILFDCKKIKNSTKLYMVFRTNFFKLINYKLYLIFLFASLAVSIGLQLVLPFPYGLGAALAIFIIFPLILRKKYMARMGGSGGSGFGLGRGFFGQGQDQGTSIRYVCLTCNHRFKGGDCPRCGSKMKRADF